MEVYCLKLGELKSNTYIVSVGKQCFIIDPGFEAEKILEFIKSKKLQPQFIYITHGHHDHTGAAKNIKEVYHIPVYAPLKDKVWMIDNIYNYWPFEVPVDQYVVEGDEIEFEGLMFKVIEVPGHSEGSTALYSSPYAFVGDTLFFQAIGRTDIPFSNHQVLIESIKTKLFTLPDDTIIYPGHGKETTVLHEKIYNPFFK